MDTAAARGGSAFPKYSTHLGDLGGFMFNGVYSLAVKKTFLVQIPGVYQGAGVAGQLFLTSGIFSIETYLIFFNAFLLNQGERALGVGSASFFTVRKCQECFQSHRMNRELGNWGAGERFPALLSIQTPAPCLSLPNCRRMAMMSLHRGMEMT